MIFIGLRDGLALRIINFDLVIFLVDRDRGDILLGRQDE
jgi:hypothetical protein